jgi:ABC-2 type transport system permease protein
MNSIITIMLKDLKQIIRDRKSFMFLLLMPIAFTFMFGYIFRSTGSSDKDTRLKVGILNLDGASLVSQEMEKQLNDSTVIRLTEMKTEAALEDKVTKKDITAGLVIPEGYGESLAGKEPMKLILWADASSTDGLSVQTEINVLAGRLASAANTARVLAPQGGAQYQSVFQKAIADWQNPPVKVTLVEKPAESTSTETVVDASSYAHSSPGMILQFAVAGLLTCAQVIVLERKNHCLQRLMTTSSNRFQILCGHFFSIFIILMAQMILLMLFGDLVLKLTYLHHPLTSLALAVASSLCIAALGLFIGVLAKAEEQAIAFSMICMFLFSGLGGLWVPLEVTGKTFQTIGHFTPLAWAMDGFYNVLVRNQGMQYALLPMGVLLGFTLLFLLAASLKFRTE